MPDPLFHGGLGLFTRSGVPKPSYWAYLFLNRLYEDIIFQAEGICITRRDNNYAILLYHYYHFNNLYGHGISFDATAKNWQAAFADPCPVQISFDLGNLRDGAYILSCQYIHPQCGSAFEAWTDMGSPDLDSPEETALLKAKSCPGFYKKTVSVSNGTLQFSEYLHPHEIRLILLNYLCC